MAAKLVGGLTSNFVRNSMEWMRHSMHSIVTWIPLVWSDYCSRRAAHRFPLESWLDLLSTNAMGSHWNTVIRPIRRLFVGMVRSASRTLSHKQSTDSTGRPRHSAACETFLYIKIPVRVECWWKMWIWKRRKTRKNEFIRSHNWCNHFHGHLPDDFQCGLMKMLWTKQFEHFY